MVEERFLQISCEEVWRELSNYIEDDVDPELRARMEKHFPQCMHCTAVLDGTRNIIRLVGDDRAFDVPASFGQRLYRRVSRQLETSESSNKEEISLGITHDRVALGSHLVYFWESDAEFERGVRFLEAGLNTGDYMVIFGHDEANEKVLGVLREKGVEVQRLLESGRLTHVTRQQPAQATLLDIGAVFQAARRRGAPAIRFLGNLGLGRKSLPGSGEDDVLELEAKVTRLARQFPCVVVCMYDVRTLPGRLILKGGFETHPLCICGDNLRENAYYVPEDPFLASLGHIH